MAVHSTLFARTLLFLRKRYTQCHNSIAREVVGSNEHNDRNRYGRIFIYDDVF